MTKVFISLGLQEMLSCLKGNLERLDLNLGKQLEFVSELELAEVVLTEPNSIYIFTAHPVVVLSDNQQVIVEYDQVVNAVPFPTSFNDLPIVRTALITAKRT